MGRRKLSEAERITAAARLAAGETNASIARDYGVHESTISRLRKLEPRAAAEPTAAEEADELQLIERDYSDRDFIYVYPIGDVHIGAPKHRASRFAEWMDYLAEDGDSSMLNTGDNINAAIVGSKSDVYDEAMTAEDAMDEFEASVAPLAMDGRLDNLADGNHEDRIYRAAGIRPMRMVARNLGVPYVEGAALFVYRVGDQEYELYMRHGTGNGQSMAQLAKSQQVVQADVYVTAHTHRQQVLRQSIFVRDGERVVRRRQVFVSSGSFVGYERYAAERGYVPSDLGAPRIRLEGSKHDVHVSV
jgi:hypothetical protein